MRVFKKLLIANRGEIAVRIIRSCRDMGLPVVAVYSDADRAARHVRMADEAYHIGGAAPQESYLNVERIMEAARRSGADALHPGYGFLSENPELPEACERAGITFVGPSAEATRR
ncbi:MAG: biotin carboxylase N-terminal domain-containing protein, partial [Chloroflexota bacterium]